MPREAIPGRMGLLLTLFMCLTNTLNSLAVNSSKSGGLMCALMTWIMICLGFILLALAEYSWILFHFKYQPVNEQAKDKNERKTSEYASKCLDKRMLLVLPPLFTTVAVVFWVSVDNR